MIFIQKQGSSRKMYFFAERGTKKTKYAKIITSLILLTIVLKCLAIWLRQHLIYSYINPIRPKLTSIEDFYPKLPELKVWQKLWKKLNKFLCLLSIKMR